MPVRDGYEISDDRARLDVDAIWSYLHGAYWSPGVPRDVVERAIEGSLCFGLYAPDGSQVGFARAVTDGVTFLWLADVFVLEQHRGRGLGVWLVESVLADSRLSGVRTTMLATRDAHELYERFGFEPLPDPGRWMRRWRIPQWWPQGGAAEKPTE
jgi:GNAT superfamily N-acetyltransferase